MSYAFKLFCVSLAAAFLVHFAAALAVNALAAPAMRAAGRMRARAAARFLLMLRLAPSGLAIFAVAALCVPSYLWFEPNAKGEGVGPGCLILAILAAGVCARSAVRAIGAILESRRWVRDCERHGHAARVAGTPAWIVPGNAVALAGLIRPRVIVAGDVFRGLSPSELEAAVRHENAHAASRDNWKLLLMLLAPETLPFFAGRFAAIEHAAKRFSEWAADDRAAGGDPERSLALASALVRVARLGASPAPAPLVTAFIDADLTARVDRLLAAHPQGGPDRWTPAVLALAATAFATVILWPGALFSVYDLLERLIH